MTLPLIVSVLALIVGGITSLGVYRLLLHPLASFPGPKLAAVTSLYHAYYDVYADGQLLTKLKELHEQYGASVLHYPCCVDADQYVKGPVVRYGPNHVRAIALYK